MGSFNCSCNDGFIGNGVVCEGKRNCFFLQINIKQVTEILLIFTTPDFDECGSKTDNCSAHATCTNNDGSYKCSCNAGYIGSGVICEGIPGGRMIVKINTGIC